MLLLCALFADDSWLFLNSLFKSQMRADFVQHRRGCGLGGGGLGGGTADRRGVNRLCLSV